jgi:hypothetical protein
MDEAAEAFRGMYLSYIKAGFDDKQAMYLVGIQVAAVSSPGG